MELELKERVALVTGSTAGIGHAIARRLAEEGAEVWVTGRTTRRVEAAVAAIRAAVPQSRVQGVAADLETSAGATALVDKLPFVHVLVNNAGAFEAKPFPDIQDAAWTRLFELNVMSGVRLSRAYLPKMLAAGDGRIIFISSESAVQIPAEMIHYGVTKTAQAALSRGLAELTIGSKVTVNSILVGPTRSEGVGEFVKQLARARGVSEEEVERDFFDTARPTSLLRRFATPEEIAAVVAFVASSVASAINGAALRADGGVVRAVF
jgi:NAD(P)-dependent dehydrogenase (short-subunit alcohol dehydrogenase family)